MKNATKRINNLTANTTAKRNAAKGKAGQVAKKDAATPETATKKVEMPKCATAHKQVGKIQRRMLTKISWIGKKPAGPNRLKRWDNYKTGMTLQHCKETKGLDHLDIGYYVDRGFMKVTPCTDKEWDAVQKAHEAAKEAKVKKTA